MSCYSLYSPLPVRPGSWNANVCFMDVRFFQRENRGAARSKRVHMLVWLSHQARGQAGHDSGGSAPGRSSPTSDYYRLKLPRLGFLSLSVSGADCGRAHRHTKTNTYKRITVIMRSNFGHLRVRWRMTRSSAGRGNSQTLWNHFRSKLDDVKNASSSSQKRSRLSSSLKGWLPQSACVCVFELCDLNDTGASISIQAENPHCIYVFFFVINVLSRGPSLLYKCSRYQTCALKNYWCLGPALWGFIQTSFLLPAQFDLSDMLTKVKRTWKKNPTL